MSAVDVYLDELFDRLAGTGSAGRRALAEADDHLRSAVEGGLARGLSLDEAQEQAVSRFGPAAQLGRKIQLANGGPASFLSGLWLLAGLCVIVLGVGRLFKAADLLIAGSPQTLSPMLRLLWTGSLVTVTGLAVLLVRRLAMRVSGLAAAGRWFPFYGACVLVTAGLMFFFGPPLLGPPMLGMFGRWGLSGPEYLPGFNTSVLTSGAAVLTAIAVAVVGVVRSGRAR